MINFKTIILVAATLLGLSSCEKEECLDVEERTITTNKTAFYNDSLLTIQVPPQQGLENADYSWTLPDGSTSNGYQIDLGYVTPEDEGEYRLEIGKSGCSVFTTSYTLDVQMPPLGCSLDSNRLQITSSNGFTFTNVFYDASIKRLEAYNSSASFYLDFNSSIDGKPKEGIYSLTPGSSSIYSVYGVLNFGFSQWFFPSGFLNVYNNNNKLTVKCCSQPFRNSGSGTETTASLWISEP
jgi:hypothetical protein